MPKLSNEEKKEIAELAEEILTLIDGVSIFTILHALAVVDNNVIAGSSDPKQSRILFTGLLKRSQKAIEKRNAN